MSVPRDAICGETILHRVYIGAAARFRTPGESEENGVSYAMLVGGGAADTSKLSSVRHSPFKRAARLGSCWVVASLSPSRGQSRECP